jgi:hypothetical protein
VKGLYVTKNQINQSIPPLRNSCISDILAQRVAKML